MSLQQFCASLSEDKQFQLAIRFAKIALPIWENYAENNSLIYYDSVVGMKHEIDKNLLKNTITEIEKYADSSKGNQVFENNISLKNLIEAFSDPIVSLQDDDFELPEEVLHTFYSVYNLTNYMKDKKQTIFDESTLYVCINQAIDAITTAKNLNITDIKSILEEYEN